VRDSAGGIDRRSRNATDIAEFVPRGPRHRARDSKAELREFPRYDVNLTARLQFGDYVTEVAVHDVSQGGVRVDAMGDLKVGDQITVTLPGTRAINGELVRGGD
jgi:hypothetical protein